MAHLPLVVTYVFLVAIGSTIPIDAIATRKTFLSCMNKSFVPFATTSRYVYTQDMPMYSSLVSSQHNPRCSNSTASKRPVGIVTPENEAEIRAAILCSREQGLQVRIRSGGHDYEGLSYICKTPFIIIDMRNLRSITIDIKHETAWVQSGATLGELYYHIAKKSQTHGFPAGICPSVGVGGHFSGGGFGAMVRKYGLAADHIIDAYLIDAKGRLINRETMGEDLFWAIRGGGGASFGVIISWKIKLVRVPPKVTVFNVHKSMNRQNTEIVHRWQHVAHKVQNELFIRVIIQYIHDDKNTSVQALFNSLFLGEVKDLIPLMDESFPELGLEPEDCTEMSWIESVLYFAGFTSGEPLEVLLGNETDPYVSYFKAKSDFVTKTIPKHVFEIIRKKFLQQKLVFLIMDPYGGRMSEIPESRIPFPHREGNLYNIQYLVKWEVNGVRASNEHIHWLRALYRYMEPHVSKHPRSAYLNYRDLDLGTNPHANTTYSEARKWGEKYFKGNFKRLAQVKSSIDPYNFFRNEQSIPLH
ncbi:berberine bridge enzyme-like 22 [Lactuca sativa]|uniref:berberine bridge enzyme-like 22 n=1 Tax=Lactuca sativa TaxID=4236 RepID=UPI000CB2D4C2|nr:berberine bridge enzyme-like 22 [Lactuca sativa]XP_052625223.1 berberine bridge enzyme-like 22 [Lactuca sativa]